MGSQYARHGELHFYTSTAISMIKCSVLLNAFCRSPQLLYILFYFWAFTADHCFFLPYQYTREQHCHHHIRYFILAERSKTVYSNSKTSDLDKKNW